MGQLGVASTPASVAGVWQRPALQSVPAGQLLPHAPQLEGFSCVLTQTLPQRTRPVMQPVVASAPASMPASVVGVVQRPATQLCPVAHALPQAPQCAVLTLVSTQNMSQSVRPDGHTTPPSVLITVPMHAPLLHVWPGKHARLHPPQLLVSRVTSTQALPHSICPLGQRGPMSMGGASMGATSGGGGGASKGVPSGGGGASKGVPSGGGGGASKGVPSGGGGGASGGTPPSVSPVEHRPMTHMRPAGHARPQPPQWSTLVFGLTQALPHGISPGPQLPSGVTPSKGVPSGGEPRSTGTTSNVFIEAVPSEHELSAATRRNGRAERRMMAASLSCFLRH